MYFLIYEPRFLVFFHLKQKNKKKIRLELGFESQINVFIIYLSSNIIHLIYHPNEKQLT